MKRPLRIGTRGSALALVQSAAVAELLRPLWPFGPVELVRVLTTGDRLQAENPARVVGRGLFVKEIESALLAGAVDICVHSAKDVPPELPEGLGLVALPPRADPRDALCGADLGNLPPGACVATGSPRRVLQLRRVRHDLLFTALRGNVDTRLLRLHSGDFDAVVLAMAGLQRLGRSDEVAEALSPDLVVPSPGQGALAIEARLDDREVVAVAGRLEDAATAFAVLAERAVQVGLGGGCSAPTGAYAELLPTRRFCLRAVVCGPCSGGMARAVVESAESLRAGADRGALAEAAARLGAAAVRALRSEGAEALLAEAPAGGEAE